MTSFNTIKGEFPDFLEISRTLIFKASKNSEPSSKSKIRLFSNAATAVVLPLLGFENKIIFLGLTLEALVFSFGNSIMFFSNHYHPY